MLRCGIVLLMLVSAGQARGGFTVMDQIGPNGAYVYGGNESQILGGTSTQFNNAFMDDFTVAGPTTLTEVDAAVLGYNGFTSYSNVQYFQVSIYSSRSAAEAIGTNLLGDVYNDSATSGHYSLNTGFATAANSALVSIPIDATLGAGTYYISVIAALDFSGGGQLAVYSSNYGGTPGGSNSFRINPSNGYNNGRDLSIDTNAAYRILGTNAVPEPSSLLLCGAGGGMSLIALRRRRRTTT